MRFSLSSIAPRAGTGAAQALLVDYAARLAAYVPAETQLYRSEQIFFEAVARHRARTAPWLVLLDPRGVELASEDLARRIGAQQDAGRQLAIFAVGPADGWSEAARGVARSAAQDTLLLSMGRMTLPHELARILITEQLYRACTILAGHPYHCGH